MDNSIFLSVIIPIYNVEKYLQYCVDSVISQNLQDYEIILVDDGSPDSCPRICDEYSKQYDFIKVIHKSNSGLSSARNVGIYNARGKYIIFVDSDDWWNPEVSVASMLETVKQKPDVEMFLFTSLDYLDGRLYKRKEHQNWDKIQVDSIENYYKSLLLNGNLEVSACTKILCKDFLVNNKLFFKEGIKSEDCEWILRVLRCLKKVDKIPEELYICRMHRQGSITNTIGLDNIRDLLGIVKESCDYYRQKSTPLQKYELSYASYLWHVALGLSCKLDRHARNSLYNLFKETSDVCGYVNSPKARIASLAVKLFGFHIGSLLLSNYIKIKNYFNFSKNRVQ